MVVAVVAGERELTETEQTQEWGILSKSMRCQLAQKQGAGEKRSIKPKPWISPAAEESKQDRQAEQETGEDRIA